MCHPGDGCHGRRQVPAGAEALEQGGCLPPRPEFCFTATSCANDGKEPGRHACLWLLRFPPWASAVRGAGRGSGRAGLANWTLCLHPAHVLQASPSSWPEIQALPSRGGPVAPGGLGPSVSLQRLGPGRAALTFSLCPRGTVGSRGPGIGGACLRPGSAPFKPCDPEQLLNRSVPRSPHL